MRAIKAACGGLLRAPQNMRQPFARVAVHGPADWQWGPACVCRVRACSTNATTSARHSASATVEPIILLLRVIDHFGAKIASPHLDDLGKVLVVLTCPAHLMLRRRCSCLLALRPCRA